MDIEIDWSWGDIFVRKDYMETPRADLLKNRETRKMLVEDMISDLDTESLESSAFYHIIGKHKPDCIIDCVI